MFAPSEMIANRSPSTVPVNGTLRALLPAAKAT
jgi:hypothetical protein